MKKSFDLDEECVEYVNAISSRNFSDNLRTIIEEHGKYPPQIFKKLIKLMSDNDIDSGKLFTNNEESKIALVMEEMFL